MSDLSFPEIHWPVTSKLKLVLIEGLMYKVYEGRKPLIKFKSPEVLSAHWVEVLRTKHKELIPDEPEMKA